MSSWRMVRVRMDTHQRLLRTAERLHARAIGGDAKLPPDVTPDGVSMDATVRWLLRSMDRETARQRSYRARRSESRAKDA